MRTVTVAVMLGLLAACSAIWAQDAAPPDAGAPPAVAPGGAAPVESGAIPAPDPEAPGSEMMGEEVPPEPPKKKLPVVPIALGIAVIAIIGAVVAGKKGEGGS